MHFGSCVYLTLLTTAVALAIRSAISSRRFARASLQTSPNNLSKPRVPLRSRPTPTRGRLAKPQVSVNGPVESLTHKTHEVAFDQNDEAHQCHLDELFTLRGLLDRNRVLAVDITCFGGQIKEFGNGFAHQARSNPTCIPSATSFIFDENCVQFREGISLSWHD
jgi:hypothetical protein